MRIAAAAQLLSRLVHHGAAIGGLDVALCSSTIKPASVASLCELNGRYFSSEGDAKAVEQPSNKPAGAPQPPARQKQQQQQQQQAAHQQAAAPAAKAGVTNAGKQRQPQRQSKPRQEQQQQQQQQQQPPPEEEPLRLWHSDADVAQLASLPVNKYFDVPRNVCPEASKQFYQDPVLAEERVNQPNYGCRAVQAEASFFGGAGAAMPLLNRRCLQDLVQAVARQQRPHIYLDGWAGSGKSVALYALVNWARANGWLALYLPTANLLVEGGTYYKGEDGLWDTPEAARLILTAAKDNHDRLLKKLHGSDGQPLSKLVAEGLAAKAPRDVVAAAVKLKEELYAVKDVPVLFAVDDYNVLYSHTHYYEAMHATHHRTLAPEELRLVRTFRLLEQPVPANGVVVAAPTFGQTVSDKLRVPVPKRSRLHVPRYGLDELAATVEYFQSVGHIAGQPDEAMLRRALFLVNGNAKELREYAPTVLHADDPLGISLGYKAKASRLKEYMETV